MSLSVSHSTLFHAGSTKSSPYHALSTTTSLHSMEPDTSTDNIVTNAHRNLIGAFSGSESVYGVSNSSRCSLQNTPKAHNFVTAFLTTFLTLQTTHDSTLETGSTIYESTEPRRGGDALYRLGFLGVFLMTSLMPSATPAPPPLRRLVHSTPATARTAAAPTDSRKVLRGASRDRRTGECG